MIIVGEMENCTTLVTELFANACAHTYVIKNGDGNSVRRGNRKKDVLGGGGTSRGGETRKQKHHSLVSRH